MAEALAFVGGTSALITLSDDFLRAARKLRYYIRTLKHAKEEIEAVEVDTTTCGNILVLFNNALEEDPSPMAEKVRKLEIDKNLQKRSSSLLQKIQMILEKRLRPMSKKHSSGALQRRAAQCVWLFQKSEINEILNELERVKASVQMCMGLVIYAALKNKASQMAVIPPELDDRLKTMERSLRYMTRTCARLEESLAEHKPVQAEDESPFYELVANLVQREINESRERRRNDRSQRRAARQGSLAPNTDSTSSRRSPSPSVPSPNISPRPPGPPPTPGGALAAENPINSPRSVSPPESADLGYCYDCGRHHILFGTADPHDQHVPDFTTYSHSSVSSLPSEPTGSQSGPPPPDDERIPGSRRTWMRAEGPPVWEERPREGGRGTDDVDDVPKTDRPD